MAADGPQRLVRCENVRVDPNATTKEYTMRVDGGCHCGSITFEAGIDPDAVGICHCTGERLERFARWTIPGMSSPRSG